MSKILKNLLIGIIEGVALFIAFLGINILIRQTEGRAFIYSGIEPAYQRCYSFDSDIEEINTSLKNEFGDFYKGYNYYGITTIFKDKLSKSHYIYMANEYFNQDLFFTLKKGDYLKFTQDNNEFPILVGGDKYKNKKIGDTMEITLTKLDKSEIKVNATIVGILSSRLSRYPEAIDSNEVYKMMDEGFVVSKDTYLKDVVDLSNLNVMLNFKDSHNEVYKDFIEKVDTYGSYVPLRINSNYSLYEFIFSKTLFILFIVIGIALALFLNILFIIINKEKSLKQLLKLSSIISCLLCIIIYNNQKGILQAFRMSYMLILIPVILAIIILVFVLIYNKKNAKIDSLVEEYKEYEKI